ncbi:MEN1 [Branchiostoma lanceolatum]|uniref:Menin n=1 Tax=Branchiostoma lanceolatum TaxID=7740 RepID=A0A8K0EQ12_BRALA|nr:MEN1 [Branchiostoma lanceolatum]
MAGFRDEDKRHFPLQDIKSVVELFRSQLSCSVEPNLALLSVTLGYIENVLTNNRALNKVDSGANLEPIFPVVELAPVEALYHKFVCQIKGSVDLSQFTHGVATRDLVKKVSDVIWSSLSRSYHTDRAHLQSLYSYLTGNRLDCFGVAFAVVAACQVLGYKDVHLALSEDHAWVTFGDKGAETAEVTWHGKGNEDKRGQPISVGVAEKSWLYLYGYPVQCTRSMEVAAMVSAINPSIDSHTDSIEMASLQQELLWLLYDMGHLRKYPMALGNLADLEEIDPTPDKPPPIQLFHEGIHAGKVYYNNQHVYPYTYLGSHHYRRGQFKDALHCWAQAANVIRSYNYNREDEEIYKEFLEIAHELIPNMLKSVSLSALHSPALSPASSTDDSSEKSNGRSTPVSVPLSPLLNDPECFAYLLQLYDGICQWEEGSSTPVLHIGWAKHIVQSINSFSPQVRSKLNILLIGDQGEVIKDEEEEEEEEKEKDKDESKTEEKEEPKKGRGRGSKGSRAVAKGKGEKNGVVLKGKEAKGKADSQSRQEHSGNTRLTNETLLSTIESLASKVDPDSQNEAPHPNIADLAAKCGENILNPEYLLGGLERSCSPFATRTADSRPDVSEFLSQRSNGNPFPGMTMESVLKAESPAEMAFQTSQGQGDAASRGNAAPVLGTTEDDKFKVPMPPLPIVKFASAKMKGLKELLTSTGKLNASAIKLQLTAQSQVQVVKRSRMSGDFDYGSSRRRPRRE